MLLQLALFVSAACGAQTYGADFNCESLLNSSLASASLSIAYPVKNAKNAENNFLDQRCFS